LSFKNQNGGSKPPFSFQGNRFRSSEFCSTMLVLPEGVRHMPGYFDRAAQEALVENIRGVVAAAPLYTPTMPRSGKPMSVRMTNCGALGWVTDKERGYRYQPAHPETERPWPAIPDRLLEVWNAVSAWPHPPQACLVNFYDAGARMGLHQDRDEQEFGAPVVSISLGDACLFRVGGSARDAKTVSFRLESGDVVVLGGKGRLCFHGVDRIYPSTSDLLKNGGRINLTLRRVTPAS
jgi:alkylated DNA repair protein (DNA oxidative demethylase)